MRPRRGCHTCHQQVEHSLYAQVAQGCAKDGTHLEVRLVQADLAAERLAVKLESTARRVVLTLTSPTVEQVLEGIVQRIDTHTHARSFVFEVFEC